MKTLTLLISLISLSSLFTFAQKQSASAHPELNCENAQTTIDIDRCLGLELDAAEEVLAIYLDKSKERYVGDQVLLDSIDKAQEAWLNYRQAHCSSVFDKWRDGTIRNAMFLGCSTELTQQRTVDIWRSFLTYGDSTPPLLPNPLESSIELD